MFNKKGFTILEWAIVIMIVAILAVIFIDRTQKSRVSDSNAPDSNVSAAK